MSERDPVSVKISGIRLYRVHPSGDWKFFRLHSVAHCNISVLFRSSLRFLCVLCASALNSLSRNSQPFTPATHAS